MRLAVIFMLFGLLYSCNEYSVPQDVLRNFVHYRFSNNQSKDYILEQTSGVLREKILTMSEDDFNKFINVKNLKKKKFKISYTKCSENKCFITYFLSYDILNEGKKRFSVEIKKIAELEKDLGVWKISDVNNVKTYYDSKEHIFP